MSQIIFELTNNRMLAIITFVHFFIFLLCSWANIHLYTYCLVPLINSIMLAIIFIRFGFTYGLTRFMCGEILFLYLYWLWNCMFPQPQYLYAIPMMLSTMGKTYLLITPPTSLQVDSVQNLILMQSKIQMVILIHHFLKLLTFGGQSRAIELINMAMFMKFKYSLHYGTRKAYEDIHFGLDRVSKGLGIRSLYHNLHKFISLLGYGVWNKSKQITY